MQLFTFSGHRRQGKTNSCIRLAEKLKGEGKKVLTMQYTKGAFDFCRYEEAKTDHYQLPYIATFDDFSNLGNYIPTGYDVGILEIGIFLTTFTRPDSIAYKYNKLFDESQLNEPVSVIPEKLNNLYSGRKCDVREGTNKFYTFCKSKDKNESWIKAYVDESAIHNIDNLVSLNVSASLVLPKSNKKLVAYGFIPPEYRLIFPDITLYSDASEFLETLRRDEWDYAIIGFCSPKRVEGVKNIDNCNIVCHMPSVYNSVEFPIEHLYRRPPEYVEIDEIRKLRLYYRGRPSWWKDKNHLHVNGMISPHIMIEEGVLEV